MIERWQDWYADFRAIEPVARLVMGVGLGLVAWGATALLVRLLLRSADALARSTTTQLDDDLLARIQRPTSLVAPIVGVHTVAWFLGVASISRASSLVETLLFTYVVVATFEILVLETWLERRQGLHVPGPVRQLIIGVAYGAVLLGIGSDVLGFDLTPLVATGSVTSLVLGLALQQPLSNLFAGIVLHVERHPNVGDWLMVGEQEGQVIEIGWRSTRLRTFSEDVLVVPNAALLTANVMNFAQPTPVCGRKVPVPVPLDVPPHVFDRWIREVLETIDGVVIPWDPKTKSWLVAVDDHCQRYVVRFWAREFRIHDDCESEFLKRLWYKFEEHGVQFPGRFQSVRVLEEVPPAMRASNAPRPAGYPPTMPRPAGTGEPTPRAEER